MQPGPDTVLECPHCKALARVFSLASGNTFGARLWSDGQMKAPMMPERPAVTKCRACGKFYWLYRGREVGEYYYWFEQEGREDPNADPEWKKAPQIEELTEAEYYQMIKERMWTTRNKEKQLRVFAWWRGNDRYRELSEEETGPPTCEADSPERIKNMKRLLVLLDQDDPNQCLMKAEVARQLGDFEGATGILGSDILETYRDTAERMLELCKAGSRELVELPTQ